MGKRRFRHAGTLPAAPRLDLEYWDVEPEHSLIDGQTMIGARFEDAPTIIMWALNPEQIAMFIDWMLQRVEAADMERELSGSLRGSFDFAAMGLHLEKIDGKLLGRVNGKFIGFMTEGDDEKAYGPWFHVFLHAALEKRKRERAAAKN